MTKNIALLVDDSPTTCVIRSYCRLRGIPMIFISGVERSTLANIALQYRASGYLSKPFTESDLAQALRAVVENCGGPRKRGASA